MIREALRWAADLKLLPRALLCLALGALTALAMPPVDAWWIFGLSFPVFLLLVENASWRRALLLGWLFGFGYFLGVLHWIGFAFLINAATDLWMMPFAVGGLAAVLALYWGLATMAATALVRRGFYLPLVAPLCFSMAEWLRGVLFTGFPWAVAGLAVDGMGPVAQLAALIGMSGLTLLILLWAATPLMMIKGQRGMALAILLALPLSWAWGEWRLRETPTQYVDGVNIRIVQPSVSQSDTWRNTHARAIYDELLQLSAQPSTNGKAITHIIWPESIVPFLIDESSEGRAELAKVLAGHTNLLTGAVRRSAPTAQADYFTSVLVFDGDANVIGRYDKWHLVPGGEYLPLEWILAPLGFRHLVNVPESFSAGPGPESIAVPGAGFAGPQICYEAIFAGAATSMTPRPDWLVNVTNDGWFGNSAGPYQHLAQLRLRAIEQGLPIVRAANTGISAIIDATGRYLIQSKMGDIKILDSPLPQPIIATIYSQFGDFGFVLLLLLGWVLAFAIVNRWRLIS